MRKEKKMKTHGAGNHGVLETPCVVVCGSWRMRLAWKTNILKIY